MSLQTNVGFYLVLPVLIDNKVWYMWAFYLYAPVYGPLKLGYIGYHVHTNFGDVYNQ